MKVLLEKSISQNPHTDLHPHDLRHQNFNASLENLDRNQQTISGIYSTLHMYTLLAWCSKEHKVVKLLCTCERSCV